MPQLAQIPQYNFQFQNTNPEFQNIINSYHDYVNNIIEKDRENKSTFELSQNAIETMPIGNGTEGDKQVFLDISKEYGQRIHSLADASNGLNGYANLTKQLDQLKHDIISDSRLDALKQSFIHKNTTQQRLFGEESTEVIDANGNKSTQRKNAYPKWSDAIKSKAFAFYLNHSGVKTDKDTGKTYFQGANIDLPDYIDFEAIRFKFADKIQEYEKETGHSWEGITGTLSFYNNEIEKGKNVAGLNSAIATYLRTNPDVNNFITKKIEYEHYNPSTDSFDFSSNKQKQNSIEDATYTTKAKLGTYGENIPKLYEQFATDKNQYDLDGRMVINNKGEKLKNYKGKAYSKSELFNLEHNILESDDTLEKKLNKIIQYEYNNIEKNYSNLEQDYKFQNRLPLNDALTSEHDFQLGKQMSYNEEIQNTISNLQSENKDIYGMSSKIVSHRQLVDWNDEEKKKKEKEDEANKFNVSITTGQFDIIEGNKIYDTEKALNKKRSDLMLEMKNSIGYKGNTPLTELIKNNPNLLKGNDKLQKLWNDYRNTMHQIEVNNDEVKNVDESIKKVDLSNVSFIEQVSGTNAKVLKAAQTMSKEEFRTYIDKYYKSIGQIYNENDPYFINNTYNMYDKAKKQIVEIGHDQGLYYQSRGNAAMVDMSEDNKKTYNNAIFNILRGNGGAIVSGFGIKDGTTVMDNNFQKKLISSGVYNKEKGTFDMNRISIVPIINADNEVKASLILNDKERYTLTVTGSDALGQLQAIPIREQVDYVRNHTDKNGKYIGITSKEADDRINFYYNKIGSFLTGTQIIKDNNQKDIPLENKVNISILEPEVENLRVGKSVQFNASTGVKLFFTKVDGNGVNGKIQLQAIDRNTGILRNIYKDNRDFPTFQSTLSSVAQYAAQNGKDDGSEFMSFMNYAK